MVKEYLVVDLDYNEVRGIFATPQEAEQYVDKYDTRGYRSVGFLIVPVNVEDGRIQPVAMEDRDDDDIDSSFFKKFLDEDEVEGTTDEDIDSLFADDTSLPDKLGIVDELNELK